MSRSEWGACIATGSTPLLISFLVKLTPAAWVDKFSNKSLIDEDRNAENNPVYKIYSRATEKDGDKDKDKDEEKIKLDEDDY